MKYIDKVSLWIYGIALAVGFFGQIIFSIIVWNNESLFVYHWVFGLIGIGIAFLAIFWNMYKLLK